MINKKILLISYYWFPFTGTGVYRISKFAKYLKLLGWEPVILTAEKSTGNLIESQIEEVFGEIPVYRTPIWEPTELIQKSSKSKTQHAVNPSIFYQEGKNWKQQLAVWTRLNILIPDAKISWRWSSISTGKKVIQKEQPALIFSTAPPPTTHLVAKKLAHWSGLPWVSDFRDPWTNIYYYDDVQMNPIAAKVNRMLEQSVLKQANHLTLVNNGFFPEHNLKHKATKIPNGFDRDDFPDTPSTSRNEKFTICYTGSLKMNQFPNNLLDALKALSRDHPEIARSIIFKFYGNIDARFQEEIKQASIVCDTAFPGLVPHKKAIKEMAQADMQLLVIGKSPRSKLVLSTKIFEYMMTRKPILGIGPLDGAAAKVVKKTKTGHFYAHSDSLGVKQCIVNAYQASLENKNFIEPETSEIEKYNFKNLARQLDEILCSMLTNNYN